MKGLALLPLLRWEVYFNTLYSHLLVFAQIKEKQSKQNKQNLKQNKTKQSKKPTKPWNLSINHSYSMDFNLAVSVYIS